jgi:hypothetical protein
MLLGSYVASDAMEWKESQAWSQLRVFCLS